MPKLRLIQALSLISFRRSRIPPCGV